jgi:hypothetical protein
MEYIMEEHQAESVGYLPETAKRLKLNIVNANALNGKLEMPAFLKAKQTMMYCQKNRKI